MKNIFLLLIFSSFSIFAGTKEYIVGSGSEFKFQGKTGENIKLSIYISESSFNKLGVEYFFSTGGLLAIEAWQQYILGISPTGMTMEEGYIQSTTMVKPEIMTKDFLDNNSNGVKVEDFFFSKESEIEKNKIGMETIEVPAGSILTSHYQKKRADQTVDFWISDKAGSIGLVKLISKNSKDESQNYTIELQTLLQHVRSKINAKNAVPLSAKGKMFLGEKK